MADREKKDRTKFVRIVYAILLSVTVHIQVFVFGDFILNRNHNKEIESSLPVKVFLRLEKDIFNTDTREEEVKELVAKEPSIQPVNRSDMNEESVSGDNAKEHPSNEGPDNNLTIVPPWEIDVPPKLVTPGDIGSGMDNSPLIDALPLIASIYLDESGSPFLIIYDPMPNDEALRRLNAFFSTSLFSPALVANQAVPSVLDIPLSIKGFS